MKSRIMFIALAAPLWVAAQTVERDSLPSLALPVAKAGHWSLHTNLLLDAALIPNIGGEIYVGRSWSVEGNWWHGWWSNDRRHRYWRTYGGALSVRRWWGDLARRNPLTGHHAGAYAQLLTYDFCFDGKGTLGGHPNRNFLREPTYAFGLEYGFALPLKPRFNIDFTIGMGYLGGKYYEYRSRNGHYVCEAERQRHWWGPTKLCVSLVWLLGKGNGNKGKEASHE